MKKNKKILILIYVDPGYYPPTLNAINELSTVFDNVTVIYRPFFEKKWNFPSNVEIKLVGGRNTIESEANSSYYRKFRNYFRFYRSVFFEVLFNKYNVILVYDYLATLSLYLAMPIINKSTLLWYHNHDVVSKENKKILSIGWFSLKTQEKILKTIDIFSLPSKERLKYFTLTNNTEVFVLPNFPSKARYQLNRLSSSKSESPVLLYQGTISPGHGLNEITQALNNREKLRDYSFKLLGSINPQFKSELLSEDRLGKLDFAGYITYDKLPKISSTCHIGMAINEPNAIIYQTGGSASNKIYEYAACGLPILYYDHPHYNEYLSKFEWAFATDLNDSSIESCLVEIMNNYEYYSKNARKDFENELNFEKVFSPLVRCLTDNALI